jgi:hypothetical protein
MSSVVISGDTSGAITLSAPAVAGTNTITLPAATGTVVLTGTTPTLNGITFPATQVPSADANTLDDYEEGTWTPTDASGASLTFVSTTFGRYIKIGRMVFATGMATYPSTSSTAVLAMGGLPFVSSDEPDSTWGGYITYSQYTTYPLIINMAEPFTTFNFFYNNSTNGPTNAAMSGKQIRFCIMYASAS